ncbi:hypothetical protein C3L33_10323, partial [Rhododendron williamsianum]
MDLVLSYPCCSSHVGFIFSSKTTFSAPKIKLFQSVQRFTVSTAKINEFQVNERRSANYHPSVWDPKFIESVTTSYSYEFHGGELDNSKQEVRKLLKTTPQEYPSVLLKLIDSMQRLGVAYHFEEEIKDALNLAQFDFTTANLYTTSLQFRLLRDHGYTIGSAIDDMYDIYGSIDELERFTDAVNRWSVEATDDLPEYMKICYLAMFNFGNEIAYNVLRDHGLNVVSYIKEEWSNLCGAYLVEARWFYSGFIPTLEEYLKNAWKSVGGPAAIAHACLLLGSPITRTSLDSYKASSELIYWSSIITRLSDDLGTSKDEIMRGDVAKSIQCYMNERSVTEEQAQDHIKGLVRESWRKLNETIAQNSPPTPMISMSLNMARTAHCIYQHGDGIGTSFGVTKDRVTSLIVDPIPIERHTPLASEEKRAM